MADPAPLCAPPDPAPKRPALRLPPRSCDTHAHVCGPSTRYTYSSARIYTPPDALFSDYRAMLDTLGIERAVLVQPSVYGADNTALLDALALDTGRLRGVAVIDPSTPRAELERMHALGVRGVRCNVVDVKGPSGRLPLELLQALARLIRPLGWHLELLMHVDEYPDLDQLLGDLPVDLVFGHLGYMARGQTLGAPGFQALLRLLRGGRAWVKLTGPYRISSLPFPHADVTPFAHALADAAPDRLLWGSDWPHVMVTGTMPNDGELCDLLATWMADPATRQKILVCNPAQLYGY
jgi:predicted TIM-barrel fold metal-dependent hydrolase